MNKATQTAGFSLGFSADLIRPDGQIIFGNVAEDFLATYPHIRTIWMDAHRAEIGADQLGPFNAVIIGGAKVTAQSICDSESLLAVARLGVGFDAVDVEACTQANVLVTITAGAVDRPMAEATITWMLALSHNLPIKDRLVRTGQWDQRSLHHGHDLRAHTLGCVGLGRIALKLLDLLRGFDMNQPIAHDPYMEPKEAQARGVKLVELDELMGQADFVSIHCPSTQETQNLVGAHQIGLMKPTAYLINTARGGIVDEEALYHALKEGRIAGAALDCFIDEPLREPHRFHEFDNVIMAPHCIGWTHEMFRDMAVTACQGIVDLSQGKEPHGMVNPEVLNRPNFISKWQRLQVNRCGHE